MTTITVYRKGEAVKFESIHTDQEALDKLKRYVAERQIQSQFAMDLAGKRRLSRKQLDWIHKMVYDFEHRTEKTDDLNGVKLTGIVGMLQSARDKGLKYPIIRMETDVLPPIRLGLAGEQSRFPGTVTVSSTEKSYEDRTFYCRIWPNGLVKGGRAFDDKVKAALILLEKDPVSVAQMYGQKTGSCCFCAKTLTNDDSLVAGYGPICADKFGLPHGSNG